jgi:light-regulated signal transduction histidine kinase (bacteriophytochrome)
MPDMSAIGPESPYLRLRSPGQIQGFGSMLVLHPATLRILNASKNVGSEFGSPATRFVGASLADVLQDEAVITDITDGLNATPPSFTNPLLATIGGQRFDVILHYHDGLLYAEFERLAPGAPTRTDMDRLSDAAIMGMLVPETIDELMLAGPEAIRSVSGFDRVLLYRFDDAFRGQVVGEARRQGVESFKGMFFPESDIGGPARALYTENFCRYIPQIGGATYTVEPADNALTNQPLDMSQAVLRAVAPCHVEYLSNMGVTASMSFSIVADGRLWGLFACHHYSISQLSYTQRLICEQIAMMFASKLASHVEPAAIEQDMTARCQEALRTLPILDQTALSHSWRPAEEKLLLSVVNAEGAAIYINGQIGEVGDCPEFTQLHAYIDKTPDDFDRLMRMYDVNGLFYTSSIASALPFGAEMREHGSGMMVVPLSRSQRSFLFWFRPELVVKATWAGNPSETKVQDLNARYSPRRSFAAWQEDIRDRSEPWTKLEIANALTLRDQMLAKVS